MSSSGLLCLQRLGPADGAAHLNHVALEPATGDESFGRPDRPRNNHVPPPERVRGQPRVSPEQGTERAQAFKADAVAYRGYGHLRPREEALGCFQPPPAQI